MYKRNFTKIFKNISISFKKRYKYFLKMFKINIKRIYKNISIFWASKKLKLLFKKGLIEMLKNE